MFDTPNYVNFVVNEVYKQFMVKAKKKINISFFYNLYNKHKLIQNQLYLIFE